MTGNLPQHPPAETAFGREWIIFPLLSAGDSKFSVPHQNQPVPASKATRVRAKSAAAGKACGSGGGGYPPGIVLLSDCSQARDNPPEQRREAGKHPAGGWLEGGRSQTLISPEVFLPLSVCRLTGPRWSPLPSSLALRHSACTQERSRSVAGRCVTGSHPSCMQPSLARDTGLSLPQSWCHGAAGQPGELHKPSPRRNPCLRWASVSSTDREIQRESEKRRLPGYFKFWFYRVLPDFVTLARPFEPNLRWDALTLQQRCGPRDCRSPISKCCSVNQWHISCQSAVASFAVLSL